MSCYSPLSIRWHQPRDDAVLIVHAGAADRNLNPHKGIHTPHARYDFIPDAIAGMVRRQELS